MKRSCLGLVVFLLFTLSLLAASHAEAASTPAVEAPTFFDMDKDGDGVISPEEGSYWTALTKRWERADTNRDGMVDMQEWNEIDVKALLLDRDP